MREEEGGEGNASLSPFFTHFPPPLSVSPFLSLSLSLSLARSLPLSFSFSFSLSPSLALSPPPYTLLPLSLSLYQSADLREMILAALGWNIR